MVSEVSDDGEKGRRLQRVSRLVFWDGPIRGCIGASPWVCGVSRPIHASVMSRAPVGIANRGN